MPNKIGTPLYHQMLVADYGDGDRAALMADVWRPTPFMIDVQTGGVNSDQFLAIIHWCRDHWGAPCSVIHSIEGAWQRGSATIFGWEWYGFATPEQMDQFIEAFPDATTPFIAVLEPSHAE